MNRCLGHAPAWGLSAALLLLTSLACSPTAERYESSTAAVLNGQDDRVELFELEDGASREIIQRGVAALMWAHRIDLARPAELRAISSRKTLGLCQDEAFGEQPSAAFCSATLIDDDLVLTAGHCLGRDAKEAAERCERLWITFDYLYSEPDRLATSSSSGENVFSCRQVVFHDHTATVDGFQDVGILQLDRAVPKDRRPIVIADAPPQAGDALTAASHGAGLPIKVDIGVSIVELPDVANYLVASTDSFAGGSGAPLFNAQMALVGYQVRGAVDWVDDGGCYRAAHAAEPGEQHQLAHIAIDALCASGWPSATLCNEPSACGDGLCSAGETSDDCAEDCQPPRCGDGLCELAERASCEGDCRKFLQVPAEWSEDPAAYDGPDEAPQNPALRATGGCAVQSASAGGGGGRLVLLGLGASCWCRRRRAMALRRTSGCR